MYCWIKLSAVRERVWPPEMRDVFLRLQGGWGVTLRGTSAGYVVFSLASPFTLRKKLSAAITAPMAIP